MSRTRRFYNKERQKFLDEYKDIKLYHPYAYRCMGRCKACRKHTAKKLDYKYKRKRIKRQVQTEINIELKYYNN